MAAARAVSARLGPAGGCGDSRPVRAGPRPLLLPQERAGGCRGAGRGGAGRALGREQ